MVQNFAYIFRMKASAYARCTADVLKLNKPSKIIISLYIPYSGNFSHGAKFRIYISHESFCMRK